MKAPQTIKIKNLIIREPFNGLFPVVTSVKDEIVKNIKAHGFSPAHPLIVWQEPGQKGPTLIDGHIRVSASSVAGLTEVPIYERKFSDEREALKWMFAEHHERRRNLTKAEAQKFLIKAIMALDSLNGHHATQAERDPRGRVLPKRSRDLFGESAERTAMAVGKTSASTVKGVRTVMKHGDAATKQAVLEEGMSLLKAARQVRASKTITPKAKEAPKGWRARLPIHPAAEVLPPMPPDQFNALARDIKRHGLQQRVMLWLDTESSTTYLLDGRHRLDALERNGVPIFDEATGKVASAFSQTLTSIGSDPAAVIISLNLRRRQFTPQQQVRLAQQIIAAGRTSPGAETIGGQPLTGIRAQKKGVQSK
jgi:ParB-like chromosome segregation protein Spo0J